MTSNEIQQLKKILEELQIELRKSRQEFQNYVIADEAWKKEAQPVIDMGENVQGFGKVALYILGFVASVIGATIGIIRLFQK